MLPELAEGLQHGLCPELQFGVEVHLRHVLVDDRLEGTPSWNIESRPPALWFLDPDPSRPALSISPQARPILIRHRGDWYGLYGTFCPKWLHDVLMKLRAAPAAMNGHLRE